MSMSVAVAEQTIDTLCDDLCALQEQLEALLPSNPRRVALEDQIAEKRRKIDALIDGIAGVHVEAIDQQIGEAVRRAA